MKKGLKIALIALAATAVLAAAGIFVFYLRVNDPTNVFPGATPDASLTPGASEAAATPSPGTSPGAGATPAPTPSPTPIPEDVLVTMSDAEFMKGRVNILVLGIDKSVEREASGSFRTDTMILVSVNFKTLDVDMISIPRDSYVKLYGKDGMLIDPIDPFNKVNAAFSLGGSLKHGGYRSAMNTVSALFGGIPVNYYVSFDMNAVKLIVDAMGGIDYDVDIEVTMNGRTLQPGLQHLDGQMVLDYCRQRKGSSDVARADRQQRVLMAVFNQMKSTGQIANLPKIYQAVQGSIETDLSFEQICSLSLIALRMESSQLERHMVAGDYKTVYARDCWLVDGEKLADLLFDVFGANVTLDPAVDGEAILAAVALNHEAVQVKLYNAALLYNEAKAFMSAHRSGIKSSTYDALSKNRSLLATAIRRECGAYLDMYFGLVNGLIDQAYGEAGIVRTSPAFLAEDGLATPPPDTSGVLGGIDEENEQGTDGSGGIG
ncbi:MAG TPA: LCP family protein [Clostridia bacterium]|nr:LCP family protein [Clostridia bacterium]